MGSFPRFDPYVRIAKPQASPAKLAKLAKAEPCYGGELPLIIGTGNRHDRPSERIPAVSIAAVAPELLRGTLSRVGASMEYQTQRIRSRAAVLLAAFGPIIEGCILREDLDSLRQSLSELERNVQAAAICRRYDSEQSPAPCPICNGACRWCNTPGVLLCGACFRSQQRR